MDPDYTKNIASQKLRSFKTEFAGAEVLTAARTCSDEAVDISRAAQHLHLTLLPGSRHCTVSEHSSSSSSAALPAANNIAGQLACCELQAAQQHRLMRSQQLPAFGCAQLLMLQLCDMTSLQVCRAAPR